MVESDHNQPGIEWEYRLPAKKDRTLVYKLLQVYLITMGILTAILAFVGLSGKMPFIELLKTFGLIGGFFTAVMVLCYLLTILVIKALIFFATSPGRMNANASGDSEKAGKDLKEPKPKDAATYTSYRFTADGEKIHSRSAVETKGGKHIPYRSVKKLIRCRLQNRIELRTLLSRTYIYAADEDYDNVWDFLSSRCSRAVIIERD